MLRVEITDVTGDWAVLSGVPGRALDSLGEDGGVGRPVAALSDGSVSYSGVDDADHPGPERPGSRCSSRVARSVR